MAWEHKEGQGALFKNAKKEKETHPDYRGDALVNGVLMEIAAWIKKSSSGTTFMSLSIKPKEERAAPAPAPTTQRRSGTKFDEIEDDIPF